MTIDSIGSAPTVRTPDRTVISGDTAALHHGGRPPATALETAAAVKSAAPLPTLDQVAQAVTHLNQSAQAKSQGLEFSIDKDSKRTIVKVIDQTTKEVLRQIPSPEVLELAKSLDETKSLLSKQTA